MGSCAVVLSIRLGQCLVCWDFFGATYCEHKRFAEAVIFITCHPKHQRIYACHPKHQRIYACNTFAISKRECASTTSFRHFLCCNWLYTTVSTVPWRPLLSSRNLIMGWA